MKVCSVCGCYNADDVRKCEICGVNFPVPSVPSAPPAEVETPSAVPVPQERPIPPKPEDGKPDRMALAGFILSLMGFVTCITSPLQLAALLLSVFSGKAKKFRTLRLVGILLSAVALGISLLLWIVIFANADSVFGYITDAMNEFYY